MAKFKQVSLMVKRYPQYLEVLRVCLPLVLSLSATTAMEFTDRVFLANYSIDAVSAALPAASVSFLFLVFFGGVSGYAGVFIAQYTGRGDHDKIGSIFWQAMWFSLAASAFIIILGFYAEDIFAATGHAAEVQRLECIYFTILCHGSAFHLAMITFGTFFSGRGLTRPVMLTTFAGVLINIPLDYAMIFGHFGLPEMGIAGAATATVLSWFINTLIFAKLNFTRRNNRSFAIVSAWHLHPQRFLRLLRFGIPGALQFTIDVAVFTVFILLVGRISTDALAATNIVFSVNALSFMPAMGASQGAGILVGQSLGKGRPERAVELVRRSGELLFCYVLIVGIFFCFVPGLILSPFFLQGGGQSHEVYSIAIILMRIVTAFIFFDAFYMLFSGALRGAGDTAFMMWAAVLMGISGMVLPVYVGITWFHISVITAWLFVALFLACMCAIAYLRYRAGKWKTMLVIESQ